MQTRQVTVRAAPRRPALKTAVGRHVDEYSSMGRHGCPPARYFEANPVDPWNHTAPSAAMTVALGCAAKRAVRRSCAVSVRPGAPLPPRSALLHGTNCSAAAPAPDQRRWRRDRQARSSSPSAPHRPTGCLQQLAPRRAFYRLRKEGFEIDA